MKLRTLAITIGALLLSFSISAQTAAEIEMAKKMARAQGYSESEINAMINKQKSGASSANTVVTATSVDRTPAMQVTETVTPASEKPKETLVLSDIYGHAIFQSKNMNFLPSYNIPTPANYKLAAGDEVVIDIWGAVYQNMTQEISPEGSITVPDLGPIYLAGQTIEQAEKNLKVQLGRIYSGITAQEPTTFIRLSLGRIRSFSINVVGDVVSPGTYTLPSLSTISSALYLAGGPSKIGSVRNIKVYRNNKLVKTFDLYKFMLDGDFSSNVRLEDNDLIKVSPYANLVKVAGHVKRPMTYEMVEGETVSKILEYSGGFAGDANQQRIHVTRKRGERAESFDVVSKDFSSFKLMDGDSLTVMPNIFDNKNRVYIEGSVWHQGSYAISDTLNTLQQLIAAAGGVKDDVYKERGYIQRFNERRDTIALHFSVENVLNGSEEVMLMPDDSIRIFAHRELEKRTLVYTFGEVNRPDTFVFRPGMTLGDVILLSGGFTVGAAKSNIDVARRNVNDGDKVAGETISTVYNFNLLENPNDADFELAPYDIIFVRVAPNYKKQQVVKVEGEVNFPGTYVVEKNVVRISDVIKKSGGVNRDAYVKGATIERRLTDAEYNRAVAARKMALRQANVDSTMIEEIDRDARYNVGIDLQAALDNPGSYADVVLQEGDIINVPKMNNTVKISGGVLYTNVVTYDPSLKLKDYIAMAGGYTKGSIKGNTYIVYMNGKVSTKGSSSFKVEPGCEIVVPVKSKEQMQRVSAAEIMSIASSTASVAAMVVSMINALK
ncbi:MAG: SLBB domain-containing protein [Paludibacteraceae bacterium]|nr:SLBB domain-containing protein [Paludibacteraceae bacterium]